jgi:hypothetical protein
MDMSIATRFLLAGAVALALLGVVVIVATV